MTFRVVGLACLALAVLPWSSAGNAGEVRRFAAQQSIVGSEQALSDRIFDDGQAGGSLWRSVAAFCRPLQDAMRRIPADETILFFSNPAQTAFNDAPCAEHCSLAPMNTAFARCAAVLGRGQCFLFAAARGGLVYDLTVPADGKPLAEVCGQR